MDVQAPVSSPNAMPLEIGMLLYPGMTLLDLAGPQAALGMHGRTHLFWKTLDPVTTDSGVALVPTATFADAPAKLDVQPGRERVVTDRNRFTGGGVTAGIDFGLTLLAELRGEHVAKVTQLLMEYDPAPPFNTGHPRMAGPQLIAAALKVVGEDALAEGVEVAKT